MAAAEPFWNQTGGVRPAEPVPGLFAQICADMGRHIDGDSYYPDQCARCGAPRGAEASSTAAPATAGRSRRWWRR